MKYLLMTLLLTILVWGFSNYQKSIESNNSESINSSQNAVDENNTPTVKNIYKWTDENGKVHFGDQKPESINKHETIEITERSSDATHTETQDILEKNRQWYAKQYQRNEYEDQAKKRDSYSKEYENKSRERYLKTKQANYCRSSENYLQRLKSELSAKKRAGIKGSTENRYKARIEAQEDIIKQQC